MQKSNNRKFITQLPNIQWWTKKKATNKIVILDPKNSDSLVVKIRDPF